MKRFPRRLLNPAFRAAVYESRVPRFVLAPLVGYGHHPSNLFTDLRRGIAEGLPQTDSMLIRMANLAQIVGFPEEQVWLQ